MNTPAHLLLGAALMGRGPARGVLTAACVGGFLPDASLYILAGTSLFLLGISPQRVFNELYFSDAWQTVFAIDNSVFVWGALLALSIWKAKPWAIALCGAALLHIALDFPLHHDDGRAHFWPITRWVFESPLSYWDRDHGAMWIAPIEAALATIAAISLWMHRPGVGWSVFFGVLLLAEIYTVRQWIWFFGQN